MFLHSDFGEWLAVRIHGEAIAAEDVTLISTRDLFRDHQSVAELCGQWEFHLWLH
jgi:hypothetical protein